MQVTNLIKGEAYTEVILTIEAAVVNPAFNQQGNAWTKPEFVQNETNK